MLLLTGYSDSLVPTVSRALSDSEAPVREAAAKTFDSLHSNIGTRALEEILPELLRKLVRFLCLMTAFDFRNITLIHLKHNNTAYGKRS